MGNDYESLVKEIKELREINSAEHVAIKASADKSMELATEIQSAINNFKGFATTLRFVRNSIFTIGALYLIFKEPISSILGG